jgi:hypothetical protein
MARKHTASFILELPLKTDPGDERACAIILDAGRNIGNAVLGEGSAPIPLAMPISESRSSVSGLNLHSPRPILASRPRNQNRRSRQGGSRRLGTLAAPDATTAIEEVAAEFKVPAMKQCTAITRRNGEDTRGAPCRAGS